MIIQAHSLTLVGEYAVGMKSKEGEKEYQSNTQEQTVLNYFFIHIQVHHCGCCIIQCLVCVCV